MSEPRLVVFDMAGTTVEDDGQVPAAFTVALAAHGISVTPEQINRVRGASKRQAVLRFVPEGPNQSDDAEAIYARFRQELAHRYATGGVRAIAGAADAFQDLRHRGIKVALTTGFDRDTTTLLLSSLGWLADTVETIVCGDDVAQGGPVSAGMWGCYQVPIGAKPLSSRRTRTCFSQSRSCQVCGSGRRGGR